MDLRLGDCLEVLKTIPENSVDSCVTDPPYGWRFMGKAWDAPDIEKTRLRDCKNPVRDGVAIAAGKYEQTCDANRKFQEWTEAWAREVFRVLKPGGHALVFCGPRTYHRMACGLEDAGFEIRDQIQWLFGSGFPKSMNVSIAIDKQKGLMGARGKAFVTAGAGSREDIQETSGWGKDPGHEGISDEAKQWQGWGTALKPANEPICLARKPLSESTVAKNVLKWGTGGLNIDGCRIETKNNLNGGAYSPGERVRAESAWGGGIGGGVMSGANQSYKQPQGRFPANLILSHSPSCTEEACDMFECAVKHLDEQSGLLKSGDLKKNQYKDGKKNQIYGKYGGFEMPARAGDSGGASRFFYCAKVSSRERNQGCEDVTEKIRSKARPDSPDLTGKFPDHDGRIRKGNNHPTVKPIKLMSYLCRMVTPPASVILDPFMGSGSTGIAALQEGFKFIGIEREKEYFKIAEKRIGSITAP